MSGEQITPVDRLYEESAAVVKLLDERAEISLRNAAGDNLRKSLLLAIGSYFEATVTAMVLEFVRGCTAGPSIAVEFVRNKAVSRQYHTWFSWSARNANAFFGLFGEECRALMSARVKDTPGLSGAVAAFLELGQMRNELAHGNYATFPLEKTLDEIYAAYKQAMVFVEALPAALKKSDEAHRQASAPTPTPAT